MTRAEAVELVIGGAFLELMKGAACCPVLKSFSAIFLFLSIFCYNALCLALIAFC